MVKNNMILEVLNYYISVLAENGKIVFSDLLLVSNVLIIYLKQLCSKWIEQYYRKVTSSTSLTSFLLTQALNR